MEEADQELEDLLHYLNLPGARRRPVRFRASVQESARVRRTPALYAEPAHEEPAAPSVTPRAAHSQVQQSRPHLPHAACCVRAAMGRWAVCARQYRLQGLAQPGRGGQVGPVRLRETSGIAGSHGCRVTGMRTQPVPLCLSASAAPLRSRRTPSGSG
jgi:hypothetical protein